MLACTKAPHQCPSPGFLNGRGAFFFAHVAALRRRPGRPGGSQLQAGEA